MDAHLLEAVTKHASPLAAVPGPEARSGSYSATFLTMVAAVTLAFAASEKPAIRGLVTKTDLHSDRRRRLFQQRCYEDLTVADVTSGLMDLHAIDHGPMKTVAVGNQIWALQRFGRNHLLAIEGPTTITRRRGRGVISRARIERQLGSPVPVTELADTFAEVARMLA